MNLPSTIIAEPHLPVLYNSATQTYYPTRPLREHEITRLAIRIATAHLQRGDALTSPQFAKDFAQLQLAPSESEQFAMLFLDSKLRLIKYSVLFHGTIDAASIHPREVVKAALAVNAAAAIAVHNHPSGDPTPSAADKAITETLNYALSLVGVKLIDHLIVGELEVISIAELGILR